MVDVQGPRSTVLTGDRTVEAAVGRQPLSRSDIRRWGALTVVASYGLLFVRALRFRYVEGDDGASIAFHTAGRDPDIVGPMSAYHAGADALLSLLPSSEPVLRLTAIAASAAASTVAVLLLAELVRVWLDGTPRLALALSQARPIHVVLLVVAVLAAVPELAFLSLVYLPSMIAFALILGAHLLIRPLVSGAVVGGRPELRILTACALTGLGVSIRWDLGLLALVAVADLVVTGLDYGYRRRLVMISLAWGTASLAVFVVALALTPSGVAIDRVFAVLGDRAGAEPSVVAAIGNSISVFTPAAVVLAGWGLVALDRRWQRFAVAQLAVATLAAVGLNWAVPKVFLAFFPALVLAVAAGLIDLASRLSLRAGVVGAVILAVPWVVGVQATIDDTAWGPDFELQPYDREASTPGYEFGLRLGAGSAVPTPEGPRSLWGYGPVLFGGGWSGLVEARADERNSAIETAIDQQLPVVQLQGSPGSTISVLSRHGLDPDGPATELAGFLHLAIGSGEEDDDAEIHLLTFYRYEARQPFGADGELARLIIDTTGQSEVVVFGYPSTLRDLHRMQPDALTRLGLETAILDVERFVARG